MSQQSGLRCQSVARPTRPSARWHGLALQVKLIEQHTLYLELTVYNQEPCVDNSFC